MADETGNKLSIFAEDVRSGLTANPKKLFSKYFYDDAGSDLFRAIMDLPEYYLTRAETEIFDRQKLEIARAFAAHHAGFELIELGAGDGTKTAILIETLINERIDFSYSPIDISEKALAVLTEQFKARFPALVVNPVHDDYFHGLERLKAGSERGKIVLFLGSNIGNITVADSVAFLNRVRSSINDGDLLFIGFDLQKNPQTILRAYDDSRGVTAAFNLNLLTRINRELGGNFELSKFSHYANYDPADGAARSYLISRENQRVTVEYLGKTFEFRAWEPIFMEISQKYTLGMIADIARKSGFNVVTEFLDEKRYFADSLWQSVGSAQARTPFS
ncbi:MAG: L-histidine N(alpha)-methyltransferase [Acidobacteria bacterium]|nr:L-histidine N(alpha)-methyltransferase [Acidobacteriota bacterium]